MPKNKHIKTSSSHRPFYTHPVFFVLLLASIAAITFFTIDYFNRRIPTQDPTPISKNNPDNANQSQQKTQTDKPDAATDETPSPAEPTISPDGKTPTQYDGEDPNLSSSLTGSLSTARFDNGKLIIRVNIDQYLSSGTCSLVLSDGANQLEKTANLIPSVSTSTCEGFDINEQELSSFSRPINININIISGNKQGNITGVAE
jgi:hypothetical protein